MNMLKIYCIKFSKIEWGESHGFCEIRPIKPLVLKLKQTSESQGGKQVDG